MAALRVLLCALLGMLIFGWIGAQHYVYFYERMGTTVERAQKVNSAWLAAGAIVGAVAAAMQILVERKNWKDSERPYLILILVLFFMGAAALILSKY
jgi:ABC-type Na+ efflux pump permease subunit